jgi:A/G-specific adenine glycosylase
MPWKGEKDPYKIWLSEIILQQTRVEQGWKYYERFVAEFPTIKHLASTADEKLYKLWEGLGYYSRCKNLIQTARMIANELDGVFPDNYEEIRKLKGIGPYTAAAISSFAYNEARAVVDGNVQRVIARYFGISTPVDTAAGKNFYQQLAQKLLDKSNPGLYNQAIMDFGATICKPKNPLCLQCVQQPECEAFKNGYVNELPVKDKRMQKKNRWLYYFLIEINGKIFIRKRIQRDIWQNLHEFVLLESSGPINKPFESHPFLRKLFGDSAYHINYVSKSYKQQLTHQNIQGQFILLKAAAHSLTLDSYHLIEKAKLKQYAFPKIINHFLEEELGG